MTRVKGEGWLLALAKCPGCAAVDVEGEPCGLHEEYCVAGWTTINMHAIAKDAALAMKVTAQFVDDEGNATIPPDEIQRRVEAAMLRARKLGEETDEQSETTED